MLRSLTEVWSSKESLSLITVCSVSLGIYTSYYFNIWEQMLLICNLSMVLISLMLF